MFSNWRFNFEFDFPRTLAHFDDLAWNFFQVSTDSPKKFSMLFYQSYMGSFRRLASPITRNEGPLRLHASHSRMDSGFLPIHPLFFLALNRRSDPHIDTSELTVHCKISAAR